MRHLKLFKENATYYSDNKKGIDSVFEKYPELASFGNKESYSEYLLSIFPKSKVKNIVYHGTREKFDQFDKSKIGLNYGKMSLGFNFMFDLDLAYNYGGNIKYAIVNIQNPIRVECMNGYSMADTIDSNYQEYRKKLTDESLNLDGVLGISPILKESVVIVLETNQIHQLGSQKDIQGFRNYVNRKIQKKNEKKIQREMRHLRLFEELDYKEIDPLGEEYWEDADKVFYSICTGIEKNCFIVKVGKVYLNSMRDHYLKYEEDINRRERHKNGDDAEKYPWKNLYYVEFMGGARSSAHIYFNKVTLKDLTKNRNVAWTGHPAIIESHLKDPNCLIQEKCMTQEEIKKLAEDIYELCSANTIAAHERQIKHEEGKINAMKQAIEKMKRVKNIEYKEIESIPWRPDINFG